MPAVFPFSQCVAAPLGQGLTGLARQAKQHLALLGAFCFSLSLCLKTFFVFHFCIIFISGVRISFFSPILVNIVEISPWCSLYVHAHKQKTRLSGVDGHRRFLISLLYFCCLPSRISSLKSWLTSPLNEREKHASRQRVMNWQRQRSPCYRVGGTGIDWPSAVMVLVQGQALCGAMCMGEGRLSHTVALISTGPQAQSFFVHHDLHNSEEHWYSVSKSRMT